MKHAFPMLVALTLVTGYIDALSFVAYDHVFTANMSGNTVLLGITLVQLWHPLGLTGGPAGHLVAIASFALGAAGAVLFLRKAELTARVVASVVGAEACLATLAFLARHAGYTSVVMLAAAAGAQSVLAVKAGVPGISTAYVTGTIVRAVSDAMNQGEPKHLRRGAATAAAWAAYGGGAALGALAFLALRERALLAAAAAFAVLAAVAARD